MPPQRRDAPPYQAAVSYRRNIAAISSLRIAAVSCSRIAPPNCICINDQYATNVAYPSVMMTKIYLRTCRSITVLGYGPGAVMTAQCRDEGGRWRDASTRFDGCERIDNRDGQLLCRGGGDDYRLSPAGGFRPPGFNSQITLFSAPNFNGERFQSSSEITNLPKRYNDQALSLRIDGRGAWEVCADSDFRGRCQIFDRDVSDLRQFGLGGAISSMRPAR
jgi:hypothetical protein